MNTHVLTVSSTSCWKHSNNNMHYTLINIGTSSTQCRGKGIGSIVCVSCQVKSSQKFFIATKNNYNTYMD